MKVCEHCSATALGNLYVPVELCICLKNERTYIAMNIKRFLESANEKKAKKRALEDEYQLLRNNSDRACTAKKRASETHDESL